MDNLAINNALQAIPFYGPLSRMERCYHNIQRVRMGNVTTETFSDMHSERIHYFAITTLTLPILRLLLPPHLYTIHEDAATTAFCLTIIESLVCNIAYVNNRHEEEA